MESEIKSSLHNKRNKPSYVEKRRKNKCLEATLKRINKKYVQLKDEEKLRNNKILYSVIPELLKRMCSFDALFSNLKPKLDYLGSYFDGLRVGSPTEYDLNVILTLPLNYNKIVLNSTDMKGAYTSIIMPSEFRRLHNSKETVTKGYKHTELWCDTSYRLSVSRFKSWMQKVADASINALPLEDGMRILQIKDVAYKISTKISGPAYTIKIYEHVDNIIDVDLVPTLVFKLPKKPIKSTVDFEKVAITNKMSYFVVPKPTDSDYKWRLAFPFQEKYYICKKYNMKSTLKLLKLLRDHQGFNKLASYFIKTLFLWEIVETSVDFWKKKSLSFLFLYMLKKLRDSLLKNEIKNFWCPDHNLLEKLKPETLRNWANRISHIINVVERNIVINPYVIFNFVRK